MDAADAFICLANLLNRPSYLAFFKVDHALMRPYFDTFNIFLQDFLPKLSVHFKQLEFSPEFYLIEWSVSAFVAIDIYRWLKLIHVRWVWLKWSSYSSRK